MAAPPIACTKEEHTVIRFVCAEGLRGGEMHGRLSARYCGSVLPVDVHEHPDRSSSVTLFGPFLNVSLHLYRFRCSRALLPYSADSHLCIFPTLTPSANNNHCKLFFFGAWGKRNGHVDASGVER
jgi:hypothetical protein